MHCMGVRGHIPPRIFLEYSHKVSISKVFWNWYRAEWIPLNILKNRSNWSAKSKPNVWEKAFQLQVYFNELEKFRISTIFWLCDKACAKNFCRCSARKKCKWPNFRRNQHSLISKMISCQGVERNRAENVAKLDSLTSSGVDKKFGEYSFLAR